MEKDLLKASYTAMEVLASAAEVVSVTSILESFVAHELRKLADLRDAGILSQEEFDKQKTELLA